MENAEVHPVTHILQPRWRIEIARSKFGKENFREETVEGAFGKTEILDRTSHMWKISFQTLKTNIAQRCQKGGKFSRSLNLEVL